MLQTKITSILLLLLFSQKVIAQNKYWVTFRDKAEVVFNPFDYFDQRTIDQRIRNNISLNDSTDFPVRQDYIDQVIRFADSVSWSSRWLNGLAIFASAEAAEHIKNLAFVAFVESMGSISAVAVKGDVFAEKPLEKLKQEDLALLKYQTERLQGESFSRNAIDGNGIRIAVFDVGFPGVNDHPAFAHLRDGNKIVATYDFVGHKDNVYCNHWHGTATLSCIAGKIDSVNIGLATGAEIFLARTEQSFWEKFSEEENWLAAAEWADKHGVNIISSSLGYTNKRYFNFQMDGHTSLVARAASIAASKGILVINAAGNEGSDSWHYIDTPGDADSVLTIGGTNPLTDSHIYFSSYGPASDGRLKPNLCAPGEVIAVKPKGLSRVSGTSFSTPLVAGFAACAWQTHRQWTNMELFDALEKSAHLYPYFDYAHGFGIPQATEFTGSKKVTEPTFDFVIVNNEVKVMLREQFSYAETEAALGYTVQRNFYYKVEDRNGFLKSYIVMIAQQKEMLHLFADDFADGDVLTIHFEGYTNSLEFEGEIKEIK